MANNETVTAPPRGFFGRLLAGDYGLPVTFWVFAVLVGFLFNFIMSALMVVPGIGHAIGLLLLLLWTPYGIMVLVGTWRAATRYTGPAVWAVLAKLVVILGAVVSAVLIGGMVAVVGTIGSLL